MCTKSGADLRKHTSVRSRVGEERTAPAQEFPLLAPGPNGSLTKEGHAAVPYRTQKSRRDKTGGGV